MVGNISSEYYQETRSNIFFVCGCGFPKGHIELPAITDFER